MKKIFATVLAAMFILSLCACSSGTEETFHFDLIKKYQNTNGEMYYKDTIGGVEIVDFGVKYNATLYDIENTNDNELTYYYKYEGSVAKEKGFADMKDYNVYLAEAFGGSMNSDAWVYFLESGERIFVTYFDITQNTNGLLVSVSVPTTGIVGGDNNMVVTYDSSSAGK